MEDKYSRTISMQDFAKAMFIFYLTFYFTFFHVMPFIAIKFVEYKKIIRNGVTQQLIENIVPNTVLIALASSFICLIFSYLAVSFLFYLLNKAKTYIAVNWKLYKIYFLFKKGAHQCQCLKKKLIKEMMK